MARTLFFIEALVFAALGFGGVLAAADLRAAFLAPFALSLVVPLACALSVWPFREVRLALGRVFAAPGAAGRSLESVHVLETLSAFCGRAAVAGLAFSLAAALPRLLEGGSTEEWGLLGAYLALYSLINAVASSSMAKVASRSAEVAPASTYGLTPREAEVASLIAGGASNVGLSLLIRKAEDGRRRRDAADTADPARGAARAPHTKGRWR